MSARPPGGWRSWYVVGILSVAYICSFIDRSVLLTDRGIPVPALVLHGGADENTPVAHAIRLEEHLRTRGSDAQLEIFEGEGHKVPAERTAPVIEAFIERVLDVRDH